MPAQPIYDPMKIRMVQSGCYQLRGAVYGYEKGQIFDSEDELMSPRLAVTMIRLGWAEEIKHA